MLRLQFRDWQNFIPYNEQILFPDEQTGTDLSMTLASSHSQLSQGSLAPGSVDWA